MEEASVPRPSAGEGEVVVRVRAAGVCHSDAHYRAGTSPAGPLPLTPGHEVAGTVREAGPGTALEEGERVCLHYLVTCGSCGACAGGREQFCETAAMLGKDRDGGWAEFVRVPARNAVPVPDGVPLRHAAAMMCSSATAYHALRRARLAPGERVAVLGAGGLGLSAVQLARTMGAAEVLAVDVRPGPLELAADLGARPIRSRDGDAAERIRRATGGRGVEVALEVVGRPETVRSALGSLAPGGRAALAGIFPGTVEVRPYRELIGREAELVGVSDHLLSEVPDLLEWAAEGEVRLGPVVRRSLPLEAAAVNRELDRLRAFEAEGRAVIVP